MDLKASQAAVLAPRLALKTTLILQFEGVYVISWDPVSIVLRAALTLIIAATSGTDSSTDGSSYLKICPSHVQSRASENLLFCSFYIFPPGLPWEQKPIALQALHNGE